MFPGMTIRDLVDVCGCDAKHHGEFCSLYSRSSQLSDLENIGVGEFCYVVRLSPSIMTKDCDAVMRVFLGRRIFEIFHTVVALLAVLVVGVQVDERNT